MESKNRGNLNFANNADLYSLLANVVNRKNIINIGTICKVINKNFVNVRLYNTDEYGDPIIISAVRLLHIGTSKFKITVSPAIGDNVLLLSGRDFIKTVEYNHTAEKKKEFAEPFGNATVQAILISPEEDDNNKTAISINEDGNITLETLGKIDVSIKDSFSDSGKKLVDFVMDTAKNFTLTTYDNGSAKNSIKMASDGVTINNNLSVANI
jgi:hypothetical protein